MEAGGFAVEGQTSEQCPTTVCRDDELTHWLKQAFILLTILSLLLLSVLGFHPTLAQRLAPPAIPFSDKILHFFAFGLASALFYACWVVDDSARARVWMWRHFNEALSGVVCVLFGGIISEFVQSLLPYKTVSSELRSALDVS